MMDGAYTRAKTRAHCASESDISRPAPLSALAHTVHPTALVRRLPVDRVVSLKDRDGDVIQRSPMVWMGEVSDGGPDGQLGLQQ